MSIAQPPASGRLQRLAATVAANPFFWLTFIVVMFTWPILRSIQAERELPRERPILGAVRNFTLRDQNGDAFASSDLHGRIWVASFIAVECEPTCVQSRRVMQAMDEVRRRTRNLGDAIRLVTFAVDPERATAEPLLELSTTYRARRGPWRFVSGLPARVHDILQDFQIVEGMARTRVALVDGNLRIRGYYDLADEAAVGLLLRDVGLLASRGG